MICPVVPQDFLGEQAGLLTALVLGFFFGFSLERSGFGNARKLAAQFYGYDMTVFKVMFTAVLVAMVGLYSFAAYGLVDLSLVWINPTFLWAQLVGGFLIGVGFAVSGLCPGTAVVSAASGRVDGMLTFAGAFFGTFLFSLLMDWVPALRSLYSAGAQGRSLLPDLLGVPAPWVALAVLAMALGGFLGAEKLERIFQARFPRVELTPSGGARVKYGLIGVLALVTLAAGLAPTPEILATAPTAAALEPLSLAEAIIAGDPNLLVLDLRSEESEGTIPGAQRVRLEAGDESLHGALGFAAPGSTVLLVDGEGAAPVLPEELPTELSYRYLRGGYAAWEREILTPKQPRNFSAEELARTQRQNQIAAYFSGNEAQPSVNAPPPPMPTGGRKKKPAEGGC